MTKRNLETSNGGAVKLIKAPLEIKESIKRYSTTYEQRQADDNNNLVRNTVQDIRCLICQQFFSAKNLEHMSDCHHTFCMECLHNYMLYKVTVSEEIQCPLVDCQKVISKKETCYQRIPERYKSRYQKFELNRQNFSNFKQLLCQAPNCKGTIDTTQAQLKCNTCKFQICNLCRLKHHDSKCDSSYAKNFIFWRICPDCHIFNEKAAKSENKTECKCGHRYCFVCMGNWSDEHKRCSQQADTSIDHQIFCRNSVVDSSRCWNFIKSLLLVLATPFILILVVIATILTAIGAVLFAIVFSPCLSFSQYDSCPKAVFFFPCVGVYKVGVYLKRYVGMVCSIGCDFIGRYAATIKTMCTYDRSRISRQSQSTKIQYVS